MKKLIIASLSIAAALAADAVNPILPLWEYIPDGEPYIFEDPDQPGKQRIYLYGSHDSLIKEFCGREQVVWSAPVENPSDWRYDGVIFTSQKDANGNNLRGDGLADVLFAPDVCLVENPDGTKTYYLYPNTQADGRHSMVARSNRPDGPFEVCNWDPADPKRTVGVLGFDPAVFIDDDGRVYGYWGYERSYGAELDPATMATVKPGTAIVEDMVSGRFQDGDFHFYEASSMRKIKDKYVFIFSRYAQEGEFGLGESNYTLGYGYGDSPLGPFTFGDTIIDARGRELDDYGNTIVTATPNGNTHGSIARVGDQWYVFYHRQAGLDEYSRQAMVAPVSIEVEEGPGGKVSITEGELTSEGFDINGLKFTGAYPAGIASWYTGPTPATSSYPNKYYTGSYVKATRHDVDQRNAPSDVALKANPVVNNTDGSIVGYKYFDFDGRDAVNMTLNYKPLGVRGRVVIMAGHPHEYQGGIKLGTLFLSGNEPRRDTTHTLRLTGLSKLAGRQPLFITFYSPIPQESLLDLYSFSFN